MNIDTNISDVLTLILKHILIQVVSGMEVVRELEKMGCQNGTTSKAIVINDCGELGPDE